MAAVDDKFIQGRGPAVPEPFEKVTGMEKELGPDQMQYEQTGGTVFEGGLTFEGPDQAEQAIQSLQALGDIVHRVDNPELYDKQTKLSLSMFKEHLYNQLGGNPFQISISGRARDRYNSEVKQYWNQFWNNSKPWGARLTMEESRQWMKFSEGLKAQFYNEEKQARDDKIEAFKYGVSQFVATQEAERQKEKDRLEAMAEDRLQRSQELKERQDRERLKRRVEEKEIDRAYEIEKEKRTSAEKKATEQRKRAGEGATMSPEQKAEFDRVKGEQDTLHKMMTDPEFFQKRLEIAADRIRKAAKDNPNHEIQMYDESYQKEFQEKVNAGKAAELAKYVRQTYIKHNPIFKGKPQYEVKVIKDPQWGWSTWIYNWKTMERVPVANIDDGFFNETQMQSAAGSFGQRKKQAPPTKAPKGLLSSFGVPDPYGEQ